MDVATAPPSSPVTLVLTVTSWNVLADAYIRASYYPTVEPSLLARGARTAAIVERIAAATSDVTCLQEVEPAVVRALRAAGLTTVYAAKIGKPDGVAIVTAPGVQVIETRTVAFADGAPDRDASGHVALLARVRASGIELAIATTHLRWDRPGTPPAARWATRQTRELLAALAAWPRPWIACGDLNVEPGDDVCALLATAGFIDASDGAATANPNGRAKRIDYVWHTPELAGVALPTLAVTDATPLPSAAMPSDHVPIAVRFTVQSPRG